MQTAELAILDWIQFHVRCDFLDAVLPAISWTANHGEIWIALALILLLRRRTRWAGVSSALLLIMGIEFVKLLALHTASAVTDVLLFTIVRQMIVSHTNAVETLLGVAAVAGIFAVKKFLQLKEEP